VEQLCLEESVELKTLLTEITTFENQFTQFAFCTIWLLGDKTQSLAPLRPVHILGKYGFTFIYIPWCVPAEWFIAPGYLISD